jgi:hypothetical protein
LLIIIALFAACLVLDANMIEVVDGMVTTACVFASNSAAGRVILHDV